MISVPKFFFDECVGRPIMEQVEHKLKTRGFSVTFSHLKDRFAEGELDEQWLPYIATEDWIVITSDQARKRSKGGRLPELCVEYEVTHVLFGVTLHHKSSGEKAKALLDAWDDIMGLTSVPKGSRYRLHLNNDGNGNLKKTFYKTEAMNTLYYGDNLDILRRYIKDESVDLVYLDPPFKSNQNYNVLFAEQDGTRSAAQVQAFEDTWQWDESAARAWQGTVEAGGRVSDVLRAFRTFLGDSDMLAYLSMMTPRIVELRRALKSTGSIYLHCDPTASHYLKMLMDAVFDPQNFRDDITWKRADTVKGNFGQEHGFLIVTPIPFCFTPNPKRTLSMRYSSHIQRSTLRNRTDTSSRNREGDIS